MGVRTNAEVSLQIGRDNALENLTFDSQHQQLLDTLEHTSDGSATLAAGESNFVVPFGDVTIARLIYVEASGPVTLTPGGVLATGAEVDGVGGAYPTGFVGGEALVVEIDNVSVPVAFLVADQSLTQVINRINAAAALAGVVDGAGDPVVIAKNNGSSQLRLFSSTTGPASEVDIVSGDAAVLAALGLTVATTNGAEAVPGQSPLQLRVPSSDAAGGPSNVKAFAFMTLQTGGLVIDNIDPDNSVEVVWAIAGDLLTSPPGC